MQNIEVIKTQDGSLGLYNKKLDEIYHSKYGARKEAMEKFIFPCSKIDNRPLAILDICFGIGYNTKCALENFKDIKHIDCIEIDKELAMKSPDFAFDDKINKIIENNLKKPEFIHFYFEDVRSAIKKLNKKYDIIFYDGFAPHKQPCVWSEDLIFEISLHLKNQGLLCTYNHSKPVLAALFKTGLNLGYNIKEDKIIGAVASFDKNLLDNPLCEFELNKLKTRSAITYKDKNLNLSDEEILNNRIEEVKNSKKETLSSYLKKNNSKNPIFMI